jgi:hypothetical protein
MGWTDDIMVIFVRALLAGAYGALYSLFLTQRRGGAKAQRRRGRVDLC